MNTTLALQAGNWEVAFDEKEQRLSLRHAVGGASLSGTLKFTEVASAGATLPYGITAAEAGGDAAWSVACSRDGVRERLALINPAGLANGYLVFFGREDALEITVLHRTAQSFHGTLLFAAEATLPNAFACRVRSPKAHHVLVMGDGLTDSGCNDALYDRENDRCLAFDGASISIATEAVGRFAVEASLCVNEASGNTLKVTLERDYYKRRYVPYFKPIDRKRCPSPPTGWMSWNRYFDQAGSKENLAEARLGKEHLQPFGLEFWSIESWQDLSYHVPCSTFDFLSLKPLEEQFPEGMKYVADEIRKLGFRPGIWSAPFGTGVKCFYDEHKEWFLHDAEGKPLKTWNGTYTLDPTNDEALAWVRHIHRVMAEEWGYEFFKIDGMSGRFAHYCAHFYELPQVRARFRDPNCPNPFERFISTFRESIGPNRVLLACQGHYTGPEARDADASRIGGDIVDPNCDSTWQNILNQSRATLAQEFVNNIVFFNDPDTLLVGPYRPLEEARVTTAVVALPGQMMFAGDKLTELTPERMRLLQQSLPVADVHPMELYPVFEDTPVWDLKVRRPFKSWDVVALFNWTDEAAEVGFDFAELGLDADKCYAIYEFWIDEFQDVFETGFSMEVPPHAVRLLAVHEDRPFPQILSTDRHVTQGAVDLLDEAWDEDAKTLTARVKLVGGHPTTLTVLLPEGMALDTVSADGVEAVAKACPYGIVKVTLSAAASGEAVMELKVK